MCTGTWRLYIQQLRQAVTLTLKRGMVIHGGRPSQAASGAQVNAIQLGESLMAPVINEDEEGTRDGQAAVATTPVRQIEVYVVQLIQEGEVHLESMLMTFPHATDERLGHN